MALIQRQPGDDLFVEWALPEHAAGGFARQSEQRRPQNLLPDLPVPPSGAPRVYAKELCGGARDPGTEKRGSGCSLGATHAGGIATDAPGGRRTYGSSNQAASNDARPGGTNAAIAMIAMHSAATA